MPASMKPMSGSLMSATWPLKWSSKSAAHESSVPPTSFSLYPNESEFWLAGIIVSQSVAPVAKFFFDLSRKILRNGASPCPGGMPGLSAPCLMQPRDLAPRGDLLDRDRDEVARRPDLIQLVVVAGHDVLRLRLREDDLPDAGRVLDGEAAASRRGASTRTPSGSGGSDRRRGRRRAACPCRPRRPCSPRSPRRRTAPRSRGRRGLRARRPSRAADADPSGCRS